MRSKSRGSVTLRSGRRHGDKPVIRFNYMSHEEELGSSSGTASG